MSVINLRKRHDYSDPYDRTSAYSSMLAMAAADEAISDAELAVERLIDFLPI